MSKNIHVDGVENIAYANGAVRISFFSFQATSTKKETSPDREESASLVITPEAFLRTRAACNQMFDELLAKDIFQERGDNKAEKDAEASDAQSSPKEKKNDKNLERSS